MFSSLNGKPASGLSRRAHFGDLLSVGLVDSYTERQSSTFISNFLSRALSLHTRVPDELRKLKKEFPNDPILESMSFSLLHQRQMALSEGESASFLSAREMEHYAINADMALLQHLFPHRKDINLIPPGVPEPGCRAIWLGASLIPFQMENEVQLKKSLGEARVPNAAVEVCVSCLGSSRAFGIARNQFSLHKRRNHESNGESLDGIVPLSVDHLPLREEEYRRIRAAGGHVDSKEGNIIDSVPFYTVSRSFGHFSMKNNVLLAPSRQKIIASPTTNTWKMLPGDILVMCNHSVFENSHDMDTSVDEVARVVMREVDRGHSPEMVAGIVCDLAMRFGATHSLQVAVLVAEDNSVECAELENQQADEAHPIFSEWVEPGTIYVNTCRYNTIYKEALLRDCQRCGVSLGELLFLRWKRVKDILSWRDSLSLAPFYGQECGLLQQRMEEEAQLFSHPLLHKGDEYSEGNKDVMRVFHSIADRLIS